LFQLTGSSPTTQSTSESLRVSEVPLYECGLRTPPNEDISTFRKSFLPLLMLKIPVLNFNLLVIILVKLRVPYTTQFKCKLISSRCGHMNLL